MDHKRPPSPEGEYTGGINNSEIATLVGAIITFLPHIEERMITFMSRLMGEGEVPARQVFRSIRNEESLIRTLRAMLELAPQNQDKGPEYDEIIDLFSEIKSKRNVYAHGLWWTHSSGRCFLQEASPDTFAAYISNREVLKSELDAVVARIDELMKKSLRVIYPEHFDKDGKPIFQPLERPEQPSEGST